MTAGAALQLHNPVYTLRPLLDADGDFSFDVYASTRAAEMELVDWSAQQKEDFLRMQFNAQRRHYLLNNPQAQWQVIEQDGQPVGRLITDDTAPGSFLLMDIALLPAHRGRGLGSAILRDLLQSTDRANKTVSLHVEPTNPALHLYQRLGFVVIGQSGFYMEMRRAPDSQAAR